LDLLPLLLSGLGTTLAITGLAAAVGLAVSIAAGLARLSSYRPIRALAVVYVEVFRGSSALVQIFFWYYVLPLVGFKLGPTESGVIALGLNVGAYGSEVVRAAILALDRGQSEAAVALNMPYWLAMRRIVFPQAFVAMLPSFGNLLIELMKGTSLVSLIGLTELTFAGRQIVQVQGIARRDEVFALSMALYFALAYPMTLGVGRLERYLSRGLHLGRPT
jgi:polar amino acid transport system permease protein